MGLKEKLSILGIIGICMCSSAYATSSNVSLNGILVSTKESGDTVEVTYIFPEVEISTNTENLSSVSLGNSDKTDITGKPKLPFLPLRLAIPLNRQLKTSEATIKSVDTIQITEPVEPGREAILFSRMPNLTKESITLAPEIYKSESFWPEKRERFNGIIRKKGNPLLSYLIYPVQYSPLTKTITSVREMTVRVIWQNEDKSRSQKESTIRRRQLDPQEIQIQNSPVSAEPIGRRSTSAQYLAITNDSIKKSTLDNNLQALLKKHQERGLTTKIITVEEIEKEYTGVDLPEKIRNAIITHYNNSQTEFVLLAGDSKVVPPRYYFMNDAPDSISGEPMKINILNDAYYSCLEGSQNSDGDEFWGERNDGIDGGLPDVFADVYVGRMAVETPKELSYVIEKTLKHLNGESGRKVLLAGEHLGFGGEAEYAEESMEEVWRGGKRKGYSTRSFAHDPTITKDDIYARDFTYTINGIQKHGWNTRNLVEKINTNSIGIINHLGHGLPHSNMRLQLYSRKERPYVPSSTVKKMNNSAPIFVNSQACLSGKFDYETITEYITIKMSGGAWAGIWNSNFGIGQRATTNSPSQFMQRQFWHAYFGHGYKELGKMSAYSDEMAFEKSIDSWQYRWVTNVTHLFGDPAAPITVGSEAPVVSIDPFSLTRSNTFDISWYSNVREKAGESVDPVKVELMHKGKVVYTICETLDTFDYTWNVPETAPSGEDFTIRITCLTSGVSAESEAIYIDLETKLTLLSPDGGERFMKGDTIDIRWESNLEGTVSLQLLQNNQIYETIAKNIPASEEYISWILPKNYITGDFTLRLISDEYKEWLYATSEETFNFYTPLVETFPYNCNFDNLESDNEIYDWAQSNTNELKWFVHSGHAPSRSGANNKSGPESDASGDGNYLLIDADWNGGEKRADLITPYMSLKDLKDPILTMKIHMWAEKPKAKMGGFYVFLSVDGEFKLLLNKNATESSPDKWIEESVDLTPYASADSFYIHIAANSIGCDIAFDDFVITGDDTGSVSISPEFKKFNSAPSCAVYPSLLNESDSKVTVKLEKSNLYSGVTYHLFDIVGNRVAGGESISKGNDLWEIAVSPKLASGSYLLMVLAKGSRMELYKAVIGKKSN